MWIEDKIIREKDGWEGMRWIHLAPDSVNSCNHGNESAGYLNGG
jgi:hypothetical protein